MDGPSDFHHQSPHRYHAAIDFNAVDIDDLFGEGLHGVGVRRWRPPSHILALRLTGPVAPLTRCLPASLIIGSSSTGLRLVNRPARTEGASRQSRLSPTLKLGHETGRGQKTTLEQYLTPIRAC